MKILTAAEMQRIDRLTSEQWGVPSLTLMENAGHAVAEFLSERFSPLDSQKILILCGRGNNGGDGLVVARLLREQGLKPQVLMFGDAELVAGDAAANLKRLSDSGLPKIVSDAAAWQALRPQLEDSTLVIGR